MTESKKNIDLNTIHPSIEQLRKILKTSITTGEAIRIIYHGGSQPGTAREISPITISKIEVLARDLASGITKTFKLAKIELATAKGDVPEYNPASPPLIKRFATISEAFSDKIFGFEAQGWLAKLSDDAISLHSFFKNGNPRKKPDIRLSFNEYVVDFIVDLDGTLREEKRKSSRPYRLEGKSFASAKTFGKLSSAIPPFLTEAEKLAPNPAT